MRENLSSGVCEQQRRRPACAFAQSDKCLCYLLIESTVKPVLSHHLKIDKTKVLKTNGNLMKVKSIAEYV